MFGAQHEFILDDRDVDEYNMDRRFEQFAHLKQNIQKLIVYSTNLWSATSWTPGEANVFGYAVAVREGMNVLCL